MHCMWGTITPAILVDSMTAPSHKSHFFWWWVLWKTMTILKLAVCGALRWWRRCKGPNGLGQFVQQICWMRWRLGKMWFGLQVSVSAWEVPNWDLGPHVQKGSSFQYQVVCFYFEIFASIHSLAKYIGINDTKKLIRIWMTSMETQTPWKTWSTARQPWASLSPIRIFQTVRTIFWPSTCTNMETPQAKIYISPCFMR